GYSSRGFDQPVAVVLTRFIASTLLEGRVGEILLDGPGASGMSGGPAFVKKQGRLFLLGMYSGVIYTGGWDKRDKDVGALGVCVDLSICWTHESAALKRLAV